MDEDNELMDQLIAYINAKWDEETSDVTFLSAGAEGDEKAARELIETFLDHCDNLKIIPQGDETVTFCWIEIRRMLKRALVVDMSKPSNRKGELPKALGLASRRDPVTRVRDRVIYFALEKAYGAKTYDRSIEECANLVIEAFQRTNKLSQEENLRLTSDLITKTYYNIRDELFAPVDL